MVDYIDIDEAIVIMDCGDPAQNILLSRGELISEEKFRLRKAQAVVDEMWGKNELDDVTLLKMTQWANKTMELRGKTS